MIPNFVKQFVRKVVKNPIKSGVIAFLVWQILKKHTSKESFVLKDNGDLVVETIITAREMSEPSKPNLWARAIDSFSRSHGRIPASDDDFEIVTSLYVKLGGGFK